MFTKSGVMSKFSCMFKLALKNSKFLLQTYLQFCEENSGINLMG